MMKTFLFLIMILEVMSSGMILTKNFVYAASGSMGEKMEIEDGPEKVLILELQKTESLQGLGIAFKTLEVKQVKPGGMVENYNTKAMQDFYDKKLVSAGDKIVSVNGVTVIDDTAVKKMIAEIEFQERFTLGVKKGVEKKKELRFFSSLDQFFSTTTESACLVKENKELKDELERGKQSTNCCNYRKEITNLKIAVESRNYEISQQKATNFRLQQTLKRQQQQIDRLNKINKQCASMHLMLGKNLISLENRGGSYNEHDRCNELKISAQGAAWSHVLEVLTDTNGCDVIWPSVYLQQDAVIEKVATDLIGYNYTSLANAITEQSNSEKKEFFKNFWKGMRNAVELFLLGGLSTERFFEPRYWSLVETVSEGEKNLDREELDWFVVAVEKKFVDNQDLECDRLWQIKKWNSTIVIDPRKKAAVEKRIQDIARGVAESIELQFGDGITANDVEKTIPVGDLWRDHAPLLNFTPTERMRGYDLKWLFRQPAAQEFLSEYEYIAASNGESTDKVRRRR